MRFVTVATHSDGYFEYLLQSCIRHNIKLDVLGWGMQFGGWIWRLKLIQEYYKSLDPEEIVCFIDAYDVIILKDASEIEKRFLDTGARIVVAEDWNVEPLDELNARFFFGTCKNSRINAGTYIGYAQDILWMFRMMCIYNECDTDEKLDDQVMMTKLCEMVPFRFHIDAKKDIFLCICFKMGLKVADVEVDKQRVLTYKKTMDPCILHGAGKANMDEVIHQLGYNITIKETPLITRVRMYSRRLLLCIIAIIILILLGYSMRLLYKAFRFRRAK